MIHKLRVRLAYRLLKLAMRVSDTPLRRIQVDNRRLVGDKLRGAILGDAKLKRSTLREIYDYHVRTQRALKALYGESNDE